MAGFDSRRPANRAKLTNKKVACSCQLIEMSNETDVWIEDDTEIPDCG